MTTEAYTFWPRQRAGKYNKRYDSEPSNGMRDIRYGRSHLRDEPIGELLIDPRKGPSLDGTAGEGRIPWTQAKVVHEPISVRYDLGRMDRHWRDR